MAAQQQPSNPWDPNTYANNHEVRVSHVHLALAADFGAHVLRGHVDLTLEVLKAGSNRVVVDAKTLRIKAVTDAVSGAAVKFELGAHDDVFGAPLIAALPSSGKLRIAYETSPDSSAIQWLPASQTAGKRHPYMFTQCQAIHARALLPCQDTPSHKCPYTGEVTVEKPLVALMSALGDGEAPHADGKATTFRFRQPVPTPSYLIAIAAGALEKREIGPRSAVWSEKEMVDAGAHEFAQTEDFLRAAEAVCGPYVWGRYDILLLPPSFPYGGMENPCLTFVTPTLLAGDRSLANVVAHEIAHSWMGNLVSPRSWEHFWLNEGFTVFLERKIVKAVFGEKAQHLHAIIGWRALRDSVERFGHDHPYTVLNVKLKGVDPDDAFSSVPYEKGFNLLWYLEGLVGGPAAMDPFLRAHCERFKFGVTDSDEWRAFFVDYFKGRVAPDKLAAIDWDAWFHKPGMPPAPMPPFDTTLSDASFRLADALLGGQHRVAAADVAGWSSSQTVVLLERLLTRQSEELAAAKSAGNVDAVKSRYAAILRAIGEPYGLLHSRNAEVRHRWYELCIRADVEEVFPAVVAFLGEQGRMKFTRPLYRDLFQSPKGRKHALEAFAKFRGGYHSICAKMCAKDLELVA
jgi:leukotriene-A4 hydrolase